MNVTRTPRFGQRLLLLAAGLSAISTGVAAPAHALGLTSIGLKGGLGVSWVSEDIEILKTKTLRSFCGGTDLEIPMSERLSFQPEILYAVQGFSYGKGGFAELSRDGAVSFHNRSFQLMAGARLGLGR